MLSSFLNVVKGVLLALTLSWALSVTVVWCSSFRSGVLQEEFWISLCVVKRLCGFIPQGAAISLASQDPFPSERRRLFGEVNISFSSDRYRFSCVFCGQGCSKNVAGAPQNAIIEKMCCRFGTINQTYVCM